MERKARNHIFKIAGILSMIVLCITAVIAVIFVAKNPNNNEEGENSNLSSVEALDSYFPNLIKESNQIDTAWIKYSENADGTLTWTGFYQSIEVGGVTTTLDLAMQDNKTLMMETFSKAIVIPSVYEGKRVTAVNIDCTMSGAKYQQVIASYITAVVLPKSITEITQASFWGFGALEYFETPFIGTHRGSSTLGALDESKTSMPLVKMFSYSSSEYSIGGDRASTYAGELATWTEDDQGNRSNPIDNGSISSQTAVWYESMDDNDGRDYYVPGTLKKVKVTDDTSIGNRAIFNINSLQDIEITADYDVISQTGFSIGYYCFAESENLLRVKLPKIFVSISKELFSNCPKLVDVELPANLLSIPEGTFYLCSSLEKISIPTSVTEIGEAAFSGCTSLANISLFNGITQGTNGYEDGTQAIIKDSEVGYHLPSKLERIGTGAFKDVQLMKKIIVPNTVTSIGNAAFGGCYSLEEIVLPFVGAHRSGHVSSCDPMKADYNNHSLFGFIFGTTGSTADNLFVSASQSYTAGEAGSTYYIPSNLKSVTITDETKLEYGAFMNCTGLQTIAINDLADMESNSMIFDEPTKSILKEISIPYMPGHKLANLFGGNAANLPETLEIIKINHQTKIEEGAFHNCTKIKDVQISEYTQEIWTNVFYNNENLTSLTLPFIGWKRGVWDPPYPQYGWHWWWRDIEWRNAFQWIFSGTQHPATYRNDCLKYYDGYVKYIPLKLTSLTITDETEVGTFDLRNLTSLTDLTINDVNYFEEGCMHGTYSLVNLSVPYLGANVNPNGTNHAGGNVYTLGWFFGTSGSYAPSKMYHAPQIRNYYIPNSLKNVTLTSSRLQYLASSSFQNCTSISKVTVLSPINQIGPSIFYNCSNLSQVVWNNASFTEASARSFYGCKKILDINSVLPDTVKVIGERAFSGSSVGGTGYELDLSSSKYSHIGKEAFANCLKISSIVIPVDGAVLGEGVFKDCQYLSSVDLKGKQVTKYLFQNCTNLVGIDFKGITYIPEGIFSGCTSLRYSPTGDPTLGFVQDDAVEAIGAYAFQDCVSLEGFALRNTLKSIGAYAFEGCTGLYNMTIPSGCTTIDAHGWDNCNSNFHFYVYQMEKDWPTTWVENWNCYWPVYIIGHVDESIFTYVYEPELKGYRITGLVDGASLVGSVKIPTTHNGLKIVAIGNLAAHNNPLSAQSGLETVILPKTIQRIEPGTFKISVKNESGNAIASRVDVYLEHTKAEVNALNALGNPNIGWTIGETESSWIEAGLIYYKDYWQYGTGTSSEIPYIKASSLEFEPYLERNTYTGSTIVPEEMNSIKLPAILVVNDSLENSSEWNILPVDRDLFTYRYSNNISVGTATFTASINSANLDNYNSELLAKGLNPVYLTGMGNGSFEIEKAIITLYEDANSEYGVSNVIKTYDGKPWSNNVWSSQNVKGLVPGAELVGTLSTIGANVKYDDTFALSNEYAYDENGNIIYLPYSDEGFIYDGEERQFNQNLKVMRYGVDITSNFTIECWLNVTIVPKKVQLEWTGGTWEDSSKSVYLYEYTGSKMVSKAVAIDPDTKEVIPGCMVSTYTADPNAILPSATIFETGAYLTQEADGNIYNDNYILLDSKGNAFNYTDNAPNIIIDITVGYHGWIQKFKIVKKNIYITIEDLDYLIPYADKYWSYSQWSGIMEDGYKITGLNPNTFFAGELRSDGHINQAIYTFNTADDTLKNDILWYDTYNDILGVTAPYHILKNVGSNETPVYEDDSANYIVNVNASVKINYHDFDVQYYIEYQIDGVTHRDLIPYEEKISSEDGEERVYLEMQYAIDGNYYKLIAVPTDAALIPNYSIDYFYNNINQDDVPFAFQYSGTYQIGVTITGQNHNDYVKIVRLTAVKSDILLDSFDKFYDRKPVDPVKEGKILKIHNTQAIYFTYYDLEGNEIQPPIEVGTYRVHVFAEENDFFNGIDKIIEFKILPRIIEIDLSSYLNGTKKYDGKQVVIEPKTEDLFAAGYLLGEDEYGVADLFQGVLVSAGIAPGVYDAQSFYWRNGWAVYSSAGANNSHNYTVKIINSFEITKLEFDISENNIDTPFDYNFHKPSLVVSYDPLDPKAQSYQDGTLNFSPVIHYSLTPFDFKNYSLSDYSTLVTSFYNPGKYKVYYHVQFDNYVTVMDYLEVEIKQREIEYIDPAKVVVNEDDRDYEYIVDYDGYYHEYAIEVTEPLYGYTVSYSLDGVNWTQIPYSFDEIGIYQIYYKIEAPYYDTVYSIRDGSVNPIDFIITDDRLPIYDSSLADIQSKSFEFDTLEHSIAVNVTKPADSDFMNVFYSVDNGQTWLSYLPTFTDPGEYVYSVKIAAQNYRSYTAQATLTITPREFKDLSLNDYLGVFDAQYHTVTITSDRLITEQIPITSIDPVTGNEITTYVTRYYYLDYMTPTDTEPTKVEVTFDYTSNPYVVDAGYGWDPNLAYKDVGKYMMYARINAVGYKSWTNDNTPGYVEITILDDKDADVIEGQKFEYTKQPFDGNKIEVNTFHDGAKIYYYYTAHPDGAGGYYIDDNPDRIAPPTELGPYYVKIQYLATKNCKALVVDGYFEIIPKTLEVKWIEEWTYDGMAHFPEAYVETGTGDIIELFEDLIGGSGDPIEAGDYEFAITMVADNPNYVLDRSTIVMKIKKIYLQIEIYDTKEYDGEVWKKEDNWNVDHLLLKNHKFVASMQTNRAIRTTYYYSTYVTDVFSNRVQVTWDIYLVDENGEFVLDADNNYISCKDFYDYDIYVEVSITNPIIDLSQFVTDTVVEYDGNPHHIEIDLPPALDGAKIYYLDDQGNSHLNPLTYTTVGTYENGIRISKEGYETTKGTAKLIINKANLKFDIEPLEDPDDPTDDEMAVYDGYGKTTTYRVYNNSNVEVQNAPIFNATSQINAGHIRYYHSDNIEKDDLIDFYNNFDIDSPIFNIGQTEMVDAGVYYVVIYYAEVVNKWFESYGIYELKVEQRNVDVIFKEPGFRYTPTYNGFKVEFGLRDATIDSTDLVLSHYVKSPLSESSVRTISANAGYYDPKTGFEFGSIFISDGNTTNERNVYKNYHPVLSDNVYLEILRAYLTSKEFNVKDLEREYNGLVAAPDVYRAEGAGDPMYYFYKYVDETTYVECDPTDFQSDVGRYYVGVHLGLGLNYWPSTMINPETGTAIGMLYANATIIPKKQQITWEDTELTFTGEELTAKASFKDVHGTTVNLEVVYSDENGDEVYSRINAGLYQAYARFSDTTLANYLLNYELVNISADFEILKVKYNIYIGTEENGYEVIAYGTDQRWSTRVTEAMIPDLNSNLTIRGIQPTDPAVLYAIDSIPGAYYGADKFDYTYIKVYTKDTNVLVNSSIEFNVIGKLSVYANDIYFVVDNKEFTYSPNNSHGVLESGALKVTFPATNYQITYRYIDEAGNEIIGTVNEPYFENVGVYTVEFTITHPDYTAKTGEVTIEIVQKESFINFTDTLDKVYDGSAVDVSAIISTASLEFNGLPEDLVYNYYQLVTDIYGVKSYLDLGSTAPIDAGEYKVNIQCSNDIEGLLYNYTALNVDQVFKISPKRLDLEIEINEEVSQAEINAGNIYDSGVILVYTADLSQLIGGDVLEYQVQSKLGMQRNKSSHTALVYPENLVATGAVQTYNFIALDKNNDEFEYTLAWDINGTRSVNGVTETVNNASNYYLNLKFNIYIHLPLMDITVDGSVSDYDGLQHGITVNYGSMAGKTLTESYAFTKADIGTANAKIRPEYIYKTNPGVYPVYALILCDGYEPFEAEVTIEINFMTRKDVQVTENSKIYDGKPMFYNTTNDGPNYTGNPYYLPLFNIIYNTDDAVKNAELKAKDNYAIADVTINYYRNGSTLAIDPEKGCINAGSYTYVLTIPQSDFFAEYKYSGTISIKSATILVEDMDTLYTTPYTGSLGSCSDVNAFYNVSIKNADGSLSELPGGLSISGTIVTTGVNAGIYGRSQKTEGTISGDIEWFRGYCSVMQNGQNVSDNYYVSLDQASITITPVEMEYEIIDKDIPYDGQFHYIILETVQSSDGKNLYISPKVPVKYDSFEWYDTTKGAWVKTYFDSTTEKWVNPFTAVNRGSYDVEIKLTAKNYQDEIFVVTMNIVEAETTIELAAPLDKIYDGREMGIPEIISNNTDVDKFDYIYRYYMYVPERDTDNIPDKTDYALMSEIIYVDPDGKNQGLDGEWIVADGTGDDFGNYRPVNAGKYMVEVQVGSPLADRNFNIGTECFYFTISKQVVELRWRNFVFEYDGTPKSPIADLVVSGDGETDVPLSYEYECRTPNADIDHINAGEYLVKASIDFSSYLRDNYELDVNTIQCSFIINQRRVTLYMNQTIKYIDGNIYSFVYNDIKGFTAKNIIDNINNNGITHRVDGTLHAENVIVPEDGAPYYLRGTAGPQSGSVFYWGMNSLGVEGFRIVDNNNIEVTKNYIVEYDMTLRVDYVEVDWVAESDTVVYDELTHSIKFEFTTPNALSQYGVRYYYQGNGPDLSQDFSAYVNQMPVFSEVGSYRVYFWVYRKNIDGSVDYVHLNDPANAVNRQYRTIIITPAPINLRLENPNINLDKVYDSLDVINPNVLYDGPERDVIYTYERIGQTSDYVTDNKANVGKYRLTISLGPSASNNYSYNPLDDDITIEFEITRREILLTSNPTSKVYDGKVWKQALDNSYVSSSTPIVTGHEFSGTIQTLSMNADRYDAPEMFDWYSNYRIVDADLVDVTDNYTVLTDFDVTISKAIMYVDVVGYEGVYDGTAKTIAGVQFLDKDGNKLSTGPAGFVIEYTEDPKDLVNHPYTDTPIAKTLVGVYPISVRITAPNYEPIKEITSIIIHGKKLDVPDNPDGPEDLDPIDPNLNFEEKFTYNGTAYPTPSYTCASNGVQTVRYFTYDDENCEHPLASAPINAGYYKFIIDIATDGVYEPVSIGPQTIRIYPREVDAVWDKLTQTYTGEELVPTAKFLNINDTYTELDVLEPHINAGSYTVTAKLTDSSSTNVLASNYVLSKNYETATFTIEKKKVTEPNILDGLSTQYSYELEIFDSLDNQYYVDANGVVTKIVASDGTETLNPTLDYKIKLDLNKDADRTIGATHHTMKLVLNDPNFMWETLGTSDSIEVKYNINPLQLPNDELDLRYDYTYQWVFDGVTAIEPEMAIKVVFKNAVNLAVLPEPTAETEGEVETVVTTYAESGEGTEGEETTPTYVPKTNLIPLPATEIQLKPFDTVLSTGDFEITGYENNDRVSTNGNLAKINIEGRNNFEFTVSKDFQILAETPKLLTLKDGVIPQFIVANYDGELVEFLEDDNAPERTLENKSNPYYLAHIYDEAYVRYVYDCFATTETTTIRVFKTRADAESGDLSKALTTTEIDYSYIATGYTFVLYDENDLVLDQITTIIFGDVDGTGTIAGNDMTYVKNIINGVYTIDSIGGLEYYLAAMTYREDKVSVSGNNITEIKNNINNVSSINNKYLPE